MPGADAVPAPPADNSDQTKKELEELRQLQAQREAMGNTAIQFYNAVPATQRWHEELMTPAPGTLCGPSDAPLDDSVA